MTRRLGFAPAVFLGGGSGVDAGFVEPSDVEQGAGYIESHLNVNGRSVEQRETYGEGVLGTTMADEDGELLCGDPVVIGSGPRRGRGACEEPPSGVEGAGRG